jgi:hypothetical protein
MAKERKGETGMEKENEEGTWKVSAILTVQSNNFRLKEEC